ncbi:MFS transporter [Actinokineospora bangkokensis]|uniref:MFS transporter n=2 Tax=Actinokineospora bangkokensis TaxID=1193682 RepID=A0A1Q9LHV5_9PSEU|nr:MFS transporter [Actinokineospora bangkokensis]
MGGVTTADAVEDRSTTVWSAPYRRTTAAILLLITIAAFEQMGVSTAIPRMLTDLGGTELYSWPFTVYLSASVVATVVGGRIADRVGPGRVLYVAPAVFLAGLLVAGTAQEMVQLLVGRALQGIGTGGEVTAIYVLIAGVYPPRLRPAAFGAMASAWVLPSIVGPAGAGLVTEHLGWRWVFLALAPLALLGALLLIPALRGSARPERATPARKGFAAAAAAAAAGVPMLSWAAQHLSWWPLGLVGMALLAVALRVLLPKGTLRAARGLPRVVFARGLFSAAFLSVEAFVPLTLTAVHGYSPALAGLPLTVSALGWSAASHYQGKHPEIQRSALIRAGFAVVALGVLGMALVALPGTPAWVAAPSWLLAGAGMGMAFPSINVLALGQAAEDERGAASSALQVSDTVFSATAIAFGGVLLVGLASAAAPTAAVLVLGLTMGCVALGGALLFRGVRDPAPVGTV